MRTVMLPTPAVLRLAICRVYTSQPQQGELWVARKDQVQAEDACLSCASIAALLAFAEPGRHAPTAQGERRAAAADANDKGRLFFMQLSAVSRGLWLQPDTDCRPTLDQDSHQSLRHS